MLSLSQVVFDDVYDSQDGNIVGIAHDQMKNIYWAFTDYAIFRYKVGGGGKSNMKKYFSPSSLLFADSKLCHNIHIIDHVDWT